MDDDTNPLVRRRLDRVERALFDEEGHSRTGALERDLKRIELALFDNKGRSRIELMEVNVEKLVNLLQRSRWLWVGWICFGALAGGLLGSWLKP